MEPDQFRRMWLTSSAQPRTELMYQPIKALDTALSELWACEVVLREFDHGPTKRRVYNLVIDHTEEIIDNKHTYYVGRAYFERLYEGCRGKRLHNVCNVMDLMGKLIFPNQEAIFDKRGYVLKIIGIANHASIEERIGKYHP